MEAVIVLALVLGVIVVGLATVRPGRSNRTRKHEKIQYNYTSKKTLMTRTEMEFFSELESLVGHKYHVFPQVHLSSVFDHRVKGQNWKAAFSHINGKSVDYVLCDKSSLRVCCAIELDDRSHDAESRIKRDVEVDRIFAEANVVLVRIKVSDIHQDLKQKLQSFGVNLE